MLFRSPEVTLVSTVNGKQPGILVCGENMIALNQLLEQTKDKGLDIYTHDSLLGAHSYPEFKKQTHLVANYGFGIHEQAVDFEKFNGVVLVTTSPMPLIESNTPLNDRIFTTGSISNPLWKQVPRNDKDNSRDYSELIEKAQTLHLPNENNGRELTIGFRHQQTMNLMPRLGHALKHGSIEKILIIAGSDNGSDEYDYYNTLIAAQKEDTMIFTSGNIKYRFNQEDFGTIANMPRLLDAGQNADIYSWHLILQELVKETEVKFIEELPIEIHISWFSEKSILLYITMLNAGYKGVNLGPTTPPFITDSMQTELVRRYGCQFINVVSTEPEE